MQPFPKIGGKTLVLLGGMRAVSAREKQKCEKSAAGSHALT